MGEARRKPTRIGGTIEIDVKWIMILLGLAGHLYSTSMQVAKMENTLQLTTLEVDKELEIISSELKSRSLRLRTLETQAALQAQTITSVADEQRRRSQYFHQRKTGER